MSNVFSDIERLIEKGDERRVNTIADVQIDALKNLFGGHKRGDPVYFLSDDHIVTECKVCKGNRYFVVKVNNVQAKAICYECGGKGTVSFPTGKKVVETTIDAVALTLDNNGEPILVYLLWGGMAVMPASKALSKEKAEAEVKEWNERIIAEYLEGEQR